MARPRALVAGNWKMNGLRHEALALAGALATRMKTEAVPPCDVLVCPPAVVLAAVGEALAGSGIALGGQDCHYEPSGAHTGDIAAPMLADAGCTYVIVGHSERRAEHGETDALVRAKAQAAQAAGLVPIICVGETLAEREEGRTLDVVLGQLDGSLPADAAADTTVIAYEPVWAIGTGRTPSVSDIAEVHGVLRAELERRLKDADGVRLLYGGSVNGRNAREILAVPDVNGALVGGASLKADEFWTICHSVPKK